MQNTNVTKEELAIIEGILKEIIAMYSEDGESDE